jgi:hypothetical protein
MESIQIRVTTQSDGYVFSILPSLRAKIKAWFPQAHPSNRIFVSYDIERNFDYFRGSLPSYLYPSLLGLGDGEDLKQHVDEIKFIESSTNEELNKIIL